MKHRTYQKSSETVLIAGKEEKISIPNLTEPIPPVVWSPNLLGAFEKAHLALGRLNGLAAVLPCSAAMRDMFCCMEAVAASRVEGAEISLSDMLLFELGRGPSASDRKIRRGWQMAQALSECVRLLDDKLPLSLRLLGKLHRILSETECEEAAPCVAEWIVECFNNDVPALPVRQSVRDCMIKLERFLQDYDVPTPALLKAALAYARLYAIHPSLCRLGRILIPAIFHAHGTVTGPVIPVSEYIAAHRNRYESALEAAKDANKWIGWLELFAEAVTWAAEQSTMAMGRLRIMAKDDRVRIETLGRAADSTRKLHLFFFGRPITTSTCLADATGLTPMTVNKSLVHLERLGIVRELSGKPRKRLYQYDQCIATLNSIICRDRG